MTYQQHVQDLCAAFRVRCIIDPKLSPDDGGMGLNLEGQAFIRVAPIVDDMTYAIALHELGHALHPVGAVTHIEGSRTMRATGQYGTLRDLRLRFAEELAAWEWARRYAMRWTPAMNQVRRVGLQSYRDHAKALNGGQLP